MAITANPLCIHPVLTTDTVILITDTNNLMHPQASIMDNLLVGLSMSLHMAVVDLEAAAAIIIAKAIAFHKLYQVPQ